MPKTIHVTAAKPKVGGAIFSAPLGTQLPQNTSDPLDEAFVGLGYISADGLVNSNSPSTENVVAWGGDTVYTFQKEKPDTFKFTLIESLNPDVLKAIYGEANVTGDLETGLTVKANSDQREPRAWVVETVLRGGVLKRVVIPAAAVVSVGDLTYSDAAVMGYETTLAATPDDEGNTHYEYLRGKGAQA